MLTSPIPSDNNAEVQESASATIMKYILQNRNKKENTDIDLFFQSIAVSMKRLSPFNRAKAKLKIVSAITELEVQELKNSLK